MFIKKKKDGSLLGAVLGMEMSSKSFVTDPSSFVPSFMLLSQRINSVTYPLHFECA